MYLAVSPLGQSTLTEAWNRTAITSQYVLKRENLCPLLEGVIFISYPEGDIHSKRKMENVEAWIATKAINIHEALSKGSEKQGKYIREVVWEEPYNISTPLILL